MNPMHELGTMRVKSGLAEMLKGGVIVHSRTAFFWADITSSMCGRSFFGATWR